MPDYNFFITSNILKHLFKKLIKIRNKRTEQLTKLGDVFGDPFELAKFYVEPDCQHQNPADCNEEEPISRVKSPVFKTINDFFNREFAVREIGKNTMFILSDAGMGKTSLLMMLKLSHLAHFWPKKYEFTILKLGKSTIKEIESIENKPNTLLLLDSLDEDPLSWGRTKSRILDIMETTRNFRRVIISCRTQFFPQTDQDPFELPGRVEIGGYVCPMFFISYFDEQQVNIYLEKRFPCKLYIKLFNKKNKKLEKSIAILRTIKSLQFRPLLLSHIEDLIDSPKKDWNDFQVYKALIDSWLNREEVKLREQKHRITKKELLKGCLNVAEYMQRRNQRFISEENIDDLTKTLTGVIHLKNFNFGGRSLLNRNSLGEYRFSHYSIQEFLLSYLVITNKKEKAVFDFKVTDQILEFLLIAVEEEERILNMQVELIEIVGSDHSFNERRICTKCGHSEIYAKGNGILKCDGSTVARPMQSDFKAFVFNGLKFDDLQLHNQKLSALSFKECQFNHSNLKNTVFKNCDLSGCIFDKSNLENCHFKGCSCINTKFIECNKEDAIFDERCNFS